MNKTQFVKAVAAESGQTVAATADVVDAVMEMIAVCMEHDEKIVLPGFGSFSVQERAARTTRNPRTGKPLKVAACRVVKFRAGSKLREQAAKLAKDKKAKAAKAKK